MLTLKFATGETIRAEEGKSVFDAAKEGGIEFGREVIAARVNGKLTEMTAPLREDADVMRLTFEGGIGKNGEIVPDRGGADVFHHTSSHILAQAIKRLYPDAKLAIGPSIENGFYYDIDCETAFSPEILSQIEGEMKKIVHENAKLERFTLPREEAIAATRLPILPKPKTSMFLPLSSVSGARK